LRLAPLMASTDDKSTIVEVRWSQRF